MAKTAQQVLLSKPEKDRIRALTIVRDESQAEVVRWLVNAALPQLEHAHASVLGELENALAGMGLTGEQRTRALEEMSTVKVRADGERRTLRLHDLRTAGGEWRKTFPWGR